MTRPVPIFAALCLVVAQGCASIDAYEPYIPVDSVVDAAELKSDVDGCIADARALPQPLDLGPIASAGAQGGADNLADVPLSVWIPVLGAAGSAGAQTLRSLGLSDSDRIHAFVWCLYEKRSDDHAFLILDPALWR